MEAKRKDANLREKPPLGEGVDNGEVTSEQKARNAAEFRSLVRQLGLSSEDLKALKKQGSNPFTSAVDVVTPNSPPSRSKGRRG